MEQLIWVLWLFNGGETHAGYSLNPAPVAYFATAEKCQLWGAVIRKNIQSAVQGETDKSAVQGETFGSSICIQKKYVLPLTIPLPSNPTQKSPVP